MAAITIKDLPQSDELDHQAMRAIVGGARRGVRPAPAEPAVPRGGGIVDYPPGFGRDRPAPTSGPLPAA